MGIGQMDGIGFEDADGVRACGQDTRTRTGLISTIPVGARAQV